jgi:hypothetical protein
MPVERISSCSCVRAARVTALTGGFALLAYVLLAYCIGRLILILLRFEVDGLARASSPLLGAATMAVQLWIYGVIHVPWWLLFLAGPWLIVAVVWRKAVVAAARAEGAGLRRLVAGLSDVDPLTAGIVALTVATAGFYFLNLLAQPLAGWDAIAMWLFKARVFFDAGSVNLSHVPILIAGSPSDRHLDYPPLFPLMIDSFWVLIGHIDDVIGKSIGFMFLLSAVGAATAVLLPLLGKRLTAMIAFVLVAMPTLQTSFVLPYYMGYADYAVGALMMISLAHLYRSTRLGRDEASALSMVFAALAALTKNEGVPFLLIISVIIGTGLLLAMVRERDWPRPLLVGVVVAALIPVIAWQLYVRVHGFSNDFINQQSTHWTAGLLVSRAHTIAAFIWHLMNREDDYPWLAVAWIVSTGLAVMSRHRVLTLVWLAVTAQAIFYGLALLFTPFDLTFQLVTSADRLILQLSPCIVLLLGLALRDLAGAQTGERQAQARVTTNEGGAVGGVVAREPRSTARRAPGRPLRLSPHRWRRWRGDTGE